MVDEILKLIKTIESLRKEMILTGIQEGFSSERTIAISQELDIHITRYQMIH
jgi:hypothetical protein